jgi:hypothetical protein
MVTWFIEKRRPKKKKGGAMNAPPLEGSDTSVSSPKRQTAEAVRIDDHRSVTVSQACSYTPVIDPGNLLAPFRSESGRPRVKIFDFAFAHATKQQSV